MKSHIKNIWPYEILPEHFYPEQFESITSYISNLIYRNGLVSTSMFSKMVFPTSNPVRLYTIQDHSPVRWGNLPQLTTLDETELLKGTFHYLYKKFYPAAIINYRRPFLENQISPYVRFCPLCLKEKSYYCLHWRIKILVGCPIHNVILVERCPACTNTIKILPPFPKVGYCQDCLQDLTEAPTIALPIERRQANYELYKDLLILLCPDDSKYIRGNPVWWEVASRIKHFRKSNNLSASDLAHIMGIKPYQLLALEKGEFYEAGLLTFENYYRMVQSLNISFKSFFDPDLNY